LSNQSREGLALEPLHYDEVAVTLLANFMDGAHIGVIQGRGQARFAAESFERNLVLRKFVREKLQGYKPAETGVLGLVHHAHSTGPDFFQDAIVTDRRANHVRRPTMAAMVFRSCSHFKPARAESL